MLTSMIMWMHPLCMTGLTVFVMILAVLLDVNFRRWVVCDLSFVAFDMLLNSFRDIRVCAELRADMMFYCANLMVASVWSSLCMVCQCSLLGHHSVHLLDTLVQS
jgi:hypothetical protein